MDDNIKNHVHTKQQEESKGNLFICAFRLPIPSESNFILATFSIMMLLAWYSFSPSTILVHLRDNGVNQDISRFAKACARMVYIHDQNSVANPRIASVLVVMDLILQEGMMEKLPTTFRQILRTMIAWMQCKENGYDFNLIFHWSNYNPEDPDEWLTPFDYIEGKFLHITWFGVNTHLKIFSNEETLD